MNSFEKLEELVVKKQSYLVLGLDPSIEESSDSDLESYLKNIIDQTSEYIVGIKAQLAFYERSVKRRETLKSIMKYAKSKGLITILDVKRGDILATQKEWAKADIENFSPDIITVNAYMGEETIKAYLEYKDI
jgi:orotidine-5'-phosphate decarboxylase